MKKLLISVVLFGSAFNANAKCSIDWDTASPKVRAVMMKPTDFYFANYNSICEKLNRANAKINIIGDSGVLTGRSFAWVNISVEDKKLPIIIDSYGSSSTKLDGAANTPRAEELLWESINSAVENLLVDQIIQKLDETRLTIKSTLQR